jgi:hypothetical protein
MTKSGLGCIGVLGRSEGPLLVSAEDGARDEVGGIIVDYSRTETDFGLVVLEIIKTIIDSVS